MRWIKITPRHVAYRVDQFIAVRVHKQADGAWMLVATDIDHKDLALELDLDLKTATRLFNEFVAAAEGADA